MNDINLNLLNPLAQSQSQTQMKISVNLNEKDIIKLIIEFLANRELNISMLDLERETGIINSSYSDDILFLRQLILDGQWDDALEFIQPLKQIDLFNSKHFYYLILKYQYLELLCLKSEAGQADNQLSVDQLVTYLNDLRQYSPSEDEYKKLCLLLTSPRLQDHTEFKNWNPSSGRLQCFKEILPLVNKFLNLDSTAGNSTKTAISIAQNERLVQLIVKGLLYESCVEYCQARATSSIENYNLADPSIVLIQQHLSETDASLLSWLHALPIDTFSCPFEEKPLKLNMDKFIKPNLEATWADAILATPIKPQQLFPYNAVPTGRSRNTELMSRSLAPQYEGLSFGLSKSQIFTSGIEMNLNNPTNSDTNSTNNLNNPSQVNNRQRVNDLTRSIGLFNFESSTNENRYRLNGIKEEETTPHSPTASLSSLPKPIESNTEASKSVSPSKSNNPMHDSTLFQEYKKNKAQIIQQLEEQEKKRDEYVKQLKTPNVYNALNAVSASKTTKSQTNNLNKSNLLDNTLVPNSNSNVLDEESFLVGSPGSSYKQLKSPINNSNSKAIYSNGDSRALSPNPNEVKSPSGSSIQSPNLQSPINQSNNSINSKLKFNNNTNNPAIRPINETIKFDSLEVIF